MFMCSKAVEANEHALCHCTGGQYSRVKYMVAGMMVGAVKRHRGDECLQDIMPAYIALMTGG
jgi:hypothetical protein